MATRKLSGRRPLGRHSELCDLKRFARVAPQGPTGTRRAPPRGAGPNTKAGTVIDFTDVAVEVRDTHDPYTVFSGVNNEGGTDLSIFFWVSMLCLAVSVVLIFYLTAYYYCYIAIGKPRSKMTEDERAMEEAENG